MICAGTHIFSMISDILDSSSRMLFPNHTRTSPELIPKRDKVSVKATFFKNIPVSYYSIQKAGLNLNEI